MSILQPFVLQAQEAFTLVLRFNPIPSCTLADVLSVPRQVWQVATACDGVANIGVIGKWRELLPASMGPPWGLQRWVGEVLFV